MTTAGAAEVSVIVCSPPELLTGVVHPQATAIDVDRLTGNVARLGARKERDYIGDLPRRTAQLATCRSSHSADAAFQAAVAD